MPVLDATVTAAGKVISIRRTKVAAEDMTTISGEERAVYPLGSVPQPLRQLAARVEHASDEKIKDAVIDRLRQNPQTTREHLEVRVVRGVVFLDGPVSSEMARAIAREVASATPGATSVRNRLYSTDSG